MYNFYLKIFVPPPGRTAKILLVMKLTLIILITAILQVSASTSFAQKITLSEKNASLSQVFDDISKQTGYDFLFTASTLKNSAKVTISVKNEELSDVLTLIFQDQPLQFSIEDKSVVVLKKEQTLMNQLRATLGISVTVTGKVTDETGKPMTGVTVKIKGTNGATSTDKNGDFGITVPDNNTVLVFSYIGYETQELAAKDIAPGSVITLKATSTNLQEVVVNKGYYHTTQELNTGDVSTVSAKEIEDAPVTNPLAAIEGRVPGMFITQNTGVPNGNFTVQIRGQNSIANGNDPLYVIDGVPYTSELLPNLNYSGNGGNAFNFINTADIESIDVLKDADATAIYGSRGANGVVLITTKKGKAGPTRVDFNYYSGIGEVAHMVPYLNTQQYLEMRNEALKNDGSTASLSNGDYDLLQYDTTSYTNWQKLLIGGTAHYTDAQGSISGGNTNTQFLVSGEYNRQTTVFLGDGADQKGSIHYSLNNTSANQKLKFTLSGNYTVDNSTINPTDFTNLIPTLPPDAPSGYNPNGTLNWANSTWTNDEQPFAKLLQQYLSNTYNLVTNSVISYQLLPNLQISTSLGYTNLQTTENITTPIEYFDPAEGIITGQASYSTTAIHSWIVEPQINYHTKLWKGTLSALIGLTFEENTSQGQELDASGFTADALLENISYATSITTSNPTYTQYKYNAVYSRLNYNIEDKYLLNLTVRRDGSSRFGPGDQFGNFGSIGAGWIFSKEDFAKESLPFLSFGKLRGSYGTSGNDQITDYRYLDLYSASYFPYAGSSGLQPQNLYNPNLGWEVNRKLEGGIELGFLKDRISLTVSYYVNRSSNELVSAPLSDVTGFTSIAENLPAVVQNTGLEVTLNTVNVRTRDFSWHSSVNLTVPSNKLISYPDLSASPYANSLVIGQPLSVVKIYKSLGVNPQTGIFQFADSQGNPTYSPTNPGDLTTYVNTAPKFYGGFQNSFQYKNFTLDFLFQFVKQTGDFDYTLVPPGIEGYNQPTLVLSRWQKPGDVTSVEKFNENYNLYSAMTDAQKSSLGYSDASFIRLKNLSLAYKLPDEWIKKFKIQNAQIYLQGQNLLTFTPYKGYDPESQGFTTLPPLRVMTLGIKMSL